MKTTIIYLLHFDRPYHHAKHYLGSCRDLEARLACHRDHPDARLLQVIKAAGIGFQLARIWKGDKKRERKMKGRGLSALCPICQCKGQAPEQTHVLIETSGSDTITDQPYVESNIGSNRN